MKYKANNIDDYLNQLSPDRFEAIKKLRTTIKSNLPEGFEEVWSYNMIGYVVPHHIYPKGYHCDPSLPLPFINIASQKNFISFYHMGLYSDQKLNDWFVKEYSKQCKYKIDMGKSCIRFKKIEDIPYNLIAELVSKITVRDWIDSYDRFREKQLSK